MRRDARLAFFFVIFFGVSSVYAMEAFKAGRGCPYGWDKATSVTKTYSADTVRKIERLESCYASLKDGFIDNWYKEYRMLSLKTLIDFLQRPEEASVQGKTAATLYSAVEDELITSWMSSSSTPMFERDARCVRALLQDVMTKVCPVTFITHVEVVVSLSHVDKKARQ